MNKNTFERYLINVGIRSLEYTYSDDVLFDNINYFKKCYEEYELSAYKALLFLQDHLDEKTTKKHMKNKIYSLQEEDIQKMALDKYPIDTIGFVTGYDDSNKEKREGYISALQDVKHFLNSAMHWVSVQENLPEDVYQHGDVFLSEEVGVMTPEGFRSDTYYRKYDLRGGSGKLLEEGWSNFDKEDITHWTKPINPNSFNLNSFFEFTMTNKNGHVTKTIIPCDDWLQANRVKAELFKSKNLIKIDFEKV